MNSQVAVNAIDGAPRMSLHIRKEIRCILPYWLLAFAATVGVWLMRSNLGWPVRLILPPTMLLLGLMVGAAPFGTEFQCRTMPLLLLQPLDRAVLWRSKMIVLAVAYLALSVAELLMPVYWYPGQEHSPRYSNELSGDIFALGMLPWLTLVAQDGFIGAALTLAVAAGSETVDKTFFDEYPVYFHMFGFIVESALGIVGLYLGRRAFLRWETSPPWRPRFAWLKSFITRPMTLAQDEQQSTLGALVRKEFRLQTVTILLAALFCLGYAVIVTIVHVLPEREPMLKHVVHFYCAALPLIAGAVSVAGERQLNILEWHLTLPIAVARQFLVKVGVCLTLALGAGFLLPWALLQIRGGSPDWFSAPLIFLMALIAPTIGVCASSLQTGTMRAAVMGSAGLAAALFGAVWVHGVYTDGGIYEWFHSGPSWLHFTPWAVIPLALAGLYRLAHSRYRYSITADRPPGFIPLMVIMIIAFVAAGLLAVNGFSSG